MSETACAHRPDPQEAAGPGQWVSCADCGANFLPEPPDTTNVRPLPPTPDRYGHVARHEAGFVVDGTADPRLSLLAAAAYRATEHLSPQRSAVALFDSASAVAEAKLPGSLGVAAACVLAHAAERRRVTGLAGNLGESRSMLALALAVLDLP